MKKKTVPLPQNTAFPPIWLEQSPRDMVWESFEPVPGLPEIVFFSYSDTSEAIPIGEHRFPNAFKFNYIEKGKTSWEVDRQLCETGQGDLLVVQPDQFFRPGNYILEPCRMWTVGFRVPFISEDGIEHNWMQQHPEDIQRLLEGLRKAPRVTHLVGSPLPALRRLAKAVQQPGFHSRLDGRSAVIDLILQLLAASELESAESRQLHSKIENLIHKFDFTSGERVSVEELAAEAGVSVPHFYRLFLNQTGMTPRNYRERLRIQEACRRLTETKDSITTISMDLDFASSQHFSRVFHRLTGTTPSQWRKSNIDIQTWIGMYGHGKRDNIELREP